jgi:hypothetical protein
MINCCFNTLPSHSNLCSHHETAEETSTNDADQNQIAKLNSAKTNNINLFLFFSPFNWLRPPNNYLWQEE